MVRVPIVVRRLPLVVWKRITELLDYVTAPCGGTFSTPQGELTSPDWPKDYPAQAVCTWRIQVPTAKSIHVVFTHFELQAVNLLGNCVDYVEVFSGWNMTSQGGLHVDI